MENKYSKGLSKSNIIFGIHCLLKGILILLLFIILYSVIWIKEKYLKYLKISVYIQLLIFLFLIALILVINNPNFFDICLNCILYLFVFLSIFQIIIIILELFATIKNFHDFTKFFHECPYYRSYNDILESKYQRTCLFYNEDIYLEDQFKYICFYNSEEEYYNKYCDGIICQKNNKFYNNKDDYTKCVGINVNLISFPSNNIFYQKERQLFDKKKNKKIYLCSRKKRLDNILQNNDNPKDKNDNNKINDNNNSKYDVNNIECPDNNPSKKFIVFIYLELIIHIIVDLFFIYEIFIVRNLNKIYFIMNSNNQNEIKSNVIDSQLNSSSNNNANINTPSVNEVIVNIDRKNLYNNKDKIGSENEEDIKIEDPQNYNNEDNNIINNKNAKKRKIKIDINDNRHINIINVNQKIQICQNKNDEFLNINAIKSPKNKGRFKNKRLKEKEKMEKRNQIEEENINKYFIKHKNLKSSQLQELINISFDNSDKNISNANEDNKIETKIIKKKKINLLNEEHKNSPKIIINKINGGDENENKNIIVYNKNLNIPVNKSVKIRGGENEDIDNDMNYLKKIRQKSQEMFDNNNKYNSHNLSFDEKQTTRYEERKENTKIKNINNINKINNDNKIFDKIVIDNFNFNDEENIFSYKKEQKNENEIISKKELENNHNDDSSEINPNDYI